MRQSVLFVLDKLVTTQTHNTAWCLHYWLQKEVAAWIQWVRDLDTRSGGDNAEVTGASLVTWPSECEGCEVDIWSSVYSWVLWKASLTPIWSHSQLRSTFSFSFWVQLSEEHAYPWDSWDPRSLWGYGFLTAKETLWDGWGEQKGWRWTGVGRDSLEKEGLVQNSLEAAIWNLGIVISWDFKEHLSPLLI